MALKARKTLLAKFRHRHLDPEAAIPKCITHLVNRAHPVTKTRVDMTAERLLFDD